MTGRRFQELCRVLAWLLLLLAAPAAAGPGERALEQAPTDLKEWVESLPEGQRRHALRRLGKMSVHRRNLLFRHWDAMEEGERRKFEAFLEERAAARERGDRVGPEARGELLQRRLEQMSPESREKLAPLVRRWRDMGPGARRRMRERLERFRTLSPEDQQALIDKRFSDRSPEERAKILESLREASKALPRRPLLDAPSEQPAPIVPAPRD